MEFYLGRGPAATAGAGGWVDLAVEAVLVHDPAGLLALGRPPGVEDECLLHADQRLAPEDVPVLAGGLPVPGLRRPVGPQPRRVLAVLEHEEVPLLLPHPSQRCMHTNTHRRS
jgi:hypothetical protein